MREFCPECNAELPEVSFGWDHKLGCSRWKSSYRFVIFGRYLIIGLIIVSFFIFTALRIGHNRRERFCAWANSQDARCECSPYAGCFAIMPDGTLKRRP